MQLLVTDVVHALRSLRRSPAFSITAVATCALAIALVATMASLYNAVLLRPLPYDDPGRLVIIGRTTPDWPRPGGASPVDFVEWRRRAQSFDGIVAWHYWSVGVHASEHTAWREGAQVSTDFFDVLGVRPLRGRTFHPHEAHEGSDKVAIISERLWRTELGASETIIGTQIRLTPGPGAERQLYEIVGVLPAAVHVRYPEPLNVFVPYVLDHVVPSGNARAASGPRVLARLKEGVTIEAASSEMRAIMEALHREYPAFREYSAAVVDLHTHTFGDLSGLLRTLFATVVFILAMACLNMVNLVVGRETRRSLEVAVRTALGAPPHLLYRQAAVEYGIVVLAGAGIAILLSTWMVATVASLAPAALSRAATMAVDWNVVGVALVLAVAVTGCCVVAAARMSRQTVVHGSAHTLKSGVTSTPDRSAVRLRTLLVLAQAAFVFMLLSSASLLGHSIWKVLRVPLGFEPHGVVSAELLVPNSWITDTPEATIAFARAVVDNLRRAPGVVQAATSNLLPFRTGSPTGIIVEGGERTVFVDVNGIEAGWFDVFRIPLRAGRQFSPFDRAASQRVAIVNEAYARTYTPGRSPIGTRVRIVDWHEIVGVVGDVTELTDGTVFRNPGLVRSTPAVVYVPSEQAPTSRLVFVHVRMSSGDTGIAGIIRDAVAVAGRDVAIGRIASMPDRIRAASTDTRFYGGVLLILSAAGLLLAIAGVFGTVSQHISERRRELTIRLIVGATPARLVTGILRHVGGWLAIGIVLGWLAGRPVHQALRALLFGIEPGEPMSLMLSAGLILGFGLLAVLLAAVRITAIAPREALAAE